MSPHKRHKNKYFSGQVQVTGANPRAITNSGTVSLQMSQNGGAYSTIATATFSSGVTATFQGTFTAPTDTA